MDIHMIWASDGQPNPTMWLVAAWDSDSLAENADGFQQDLNKAYKEHGPANVRVTVTTVNFERVRAAFEPVAI